jgi:hypothetical protein
MEAISLRDILILVTLFRCILFIAFVRDNIIFLKKIYLGFSEIKNAKKVMLIMIKC